MTVMGPLGPGGTVVTKGKSTSDGVSPRVLVSYEASEEVQLNAQISQGFRLGGINDPLNLGTCEGNDANIFGGLDSFDDEELTNYEFGLKSTILDGAGTFNMAIFYSEIENLQATVDAGTCSTRLVYNVPEASSMGVEFELVAHLSESLEIGVTGSLVEAELGSTVVDSEGNVLAGLEDGNEMPTTPKFQIATSASYYFPVGQQWDGYATGVYQYVGKRYTQAVDQIASVVKTNGLSSYDAVNIRIGAKTEGLDIALFVNNLLDEQAELALDRERGGQSRLGHVVSQPRTLGVSLRKEF